MTRGKEYGAVISWQSLESVGKMAHQDKNTEEIYYFILTIMVDNTLMGGRW